MRETYAAYLELMAKWCGEEGVEIWGYCLMPNHTFDRGPGIRAGVAAGDRSYVYNAQSNVTRTTDHNGRVTTYTYNCLG